MHDSWQFGTLLLCPVGVPGMQRNLKCEQGVGGVAVLHRRFLSFANFVALPGIFHSSHATVSLPVNAGHRGHQPLSEHSLTCAEVHILLPQNLDLLSVRLYQGVVQTVQEVGNVMYGVAMYCLLLFQAI